MKMRAKPSERQRQSSSPEGALCDERHVLLECPALGDLRSQYAPLIAESSGIMAKLVWADDQPLVSKYIIACLDRSEVH